ncbi:aldo/keto reductase [Cytophagaceae bacterium YF14B1]|uniref:Aldo/keto reductase n=1 Tax=Xanthocytophaga flava TaxID=3048013 RepID=A0AAE3QLC1_9BACT|nr:aldo/keto reductase [Xanthocytophaga flavus]MDJ1481452.1 aldo/keto reductase [Xanthocytophaga flavus]
MKETTTINAATAGTFTLAGDLPVNRMGYGAMRITGQGIWGPPKDRAEAIRVLKKAVEVGVNFIDTADSYGPDVSEEIIAEALYPYPKDLVIATKGGFTRTGPNQWSVNGQPKHLKAALEGSLKRLKLDTIDLYQLHRFDPQVPVEESLGVLKDAQDKGLIRHIGLSEVSIQQIEQASKLVKVVSVQNMYNYGNQRWNDVLTWCEQNQVAFIPWYPLQAGDLSAEKALKKVAEKHNASEYQIALAWLLKASPVTLLIPGTSSVNHLEDNVSAVNISLDEEDMRLLPRK